MQRDGESESWYVHVDGEPRGPLAIRDLDVLLRTNEINSKMLGWRNGMKQWKPLIEIDELKDSIRQSSNQIIEISQKKTMFDQKKSKFGPKLEEKPNMEEEPALEEEKEEEGEDIMKVLQATVDNLVKNSFHQSEDGKWNIYDEQKKEWFTQTEEPKEQIEAFKTELLIKLKAELFSTKKEAKRRRDGQNITAPSADAEPEILTKEELQKRQKNRKKTKRAAEKKKQKWYNPKINTFVYVSGLPPDITEEELKEFACKAGVIRIDHQTGKEKIKLYKDEQGIPKGDAALSYAKEESIAIALEMLNEREIKPGFQVRIQRAHFNQKNEQYKPRDSKKVNKVNKIIAKKNEEKQLAWEENEGLEGLKIVILKGLFTPDQLGNEQLLADTKEDIKTQCQKIGQLQRIRYFETHPDGVVEVKFKEEAAAEKCIEIMNGRYFDGREIECAYWDGETNYKTSTGTHMIENGRIDEFGNWLEGQIEAGLATEGDAIGGKKVHIIQLSLEDLEKEQPIIGQPPTNTAAPATVEPLAQPTNE